MSNCLFFCHSSASWNPEHKEEIWIPVFAGMTNCGVFTQFSPDSPRGIWSITIHNGKIKTMRRIAKKTGRVKKQEVHFIATRYRDEPLNVSFYTKDGKQVAREAIEKKRTKEGVKLFVAVQ